MSRRSLALLGTGLVITAAVGGYAWLRRSAAVISPGSPVYEEVSRAFYHGFAALEVGLLDDAKAQFAAATRIAPQEPAAWANLGLTELRLGQTDPASEAIARAAVLAPSDGRIAFLQGQLETGRGRPDDAIARFKHAVDLSPTDLRVRYALAQEIEAAGGPNADAEAEDLLAQLVRLAPGNVAAILERTRLAAKRSDERVLRESVASLGGYAAIWPAVAVEQYRALQRASTGPDFPEAARTVAVLRNVLLRVPAFREDLQAIRMPAELIAEPFDRFTRLPVANSKPSVPDAGLTYSVDAANTAAPLPANAVVAVSPNGTDRPAIFVANESQIRRATAPPLTLPMPNLGERSVVLALDWNRDFKMDLVVAGANGVRLLLQGVDGSFADATTQAGPTGTITGDVAGLWAADLEMDGDLDIVAGVNGAPPVVLRNNGDGTWQRQQSFQDVAGLHGFAWADLDRDGDPDAALLDSDGNVHLFENRQGGQFQAMAGPAGLGKVVALNIGDLNGDGIADLVVLDDKGHVLRASRDDGKWTTETVAQWTQGSISAGSYRIFVEDLDNNGSPDVLVSGGGKSQIWLSDTEHKFTALSAPAGDIYSVVDLNDDGQLDCVGLLDGQVTRWLGHGTKGYHWQVFRPRAQEMAGDQRINSFGIGGEMQIRSGLLTARQIITGTSVHFGLGDRSGIDVTRIVWPNGVVQADFERGANVVVIAEQRLKGSCPWVFADNGHGMQFVTDFLWRSPLGLRINAQDTAGVSQTEDWVKIRGDQLAARDGSYDVRITAELWETHFIDYVALMAVDHHADTDIFVDERFAKESPVLAVRQMSHPHALVSATDDSGTDVSDIVARRDGRYLATFARQGYQGIAVDHFVELLLDRPIDQAERRWLIANGWVYPTDSSINVAIGQGGAVHPRGISVEAEVGEGNWTVVAPDLGFPAGKNKTVLVDLAALARAGAGGATRLRLRTNLEIYWDWLAVADDRSDTRMTMNRVAPARADLRFHGFSKTDFKKREVPETPFYDQIANIAPRWRDLEGYYTRFGDVGELLRNVDDRYVIMNAGDELRLSFPAPASVAAGWTRDFVLIGDGWEKDGDFNTTYSKTVLPLPSHDHPDYGALPPPAALEDDVVYRRHPADWQAYHTRFVTPAPFVAGLR